MNRLKNTEYRINKQRKFITTYYW